MSKLLAENRFVRLLLIAVAFVSFGAIAGLILNYQTLKGYRSSQVEVPANTAEPVAEKPKIATYSGTIKPLGPSIYMEGTHFLEGPAGEMVLILKSAKIDLGFFEGQTVKVEGTIKESVEGDKTVLEVEKIIL